MLSSARRFSVFATSCCMYLHTMKGIADATICASKAAASIQPEASDVTTEHPDTYLCPKPNDSAELMECCGDGRSCCPTNIFAVSHEMLMITCLTVIATCFVFSIAIVVCCFWNRCPLYNACRVHYTQEDIIAYGKSEDTVNFNMMPPEGSGGQTKYAVKIKPREDV